MNGTVSYAEITRALLDELAVNWVHYLDRLTNTLNSVQLACVIAVRQNALTEQEQIPECYYELAVQATFECALEHNLESLL